MRAHELAALVGVRGGLCRWFAAEGAGLRIVQVTYDSTEFQFCGSEQYLRDIPLHGKGSYAQGLEGSIFSPEEFQQYRTLADELNATERGDQAAFYLKRA